jgi:cell division initiation protein
MENELQKMDNDTSEEDRLAAQKKAEDIIKNAEKAAAEIIARAKSESDKIENAAKATESPKPEPKAEPKVEPEAPKSEPKESASARFFKKSEDEAPKPAASDEDDDEIFVGEIEDARKPDRMMIGDGEEEEDMDFEFL